MRESFFEPLGAGSYRATDATAGPWSADAEHGGPPSALAVRELERHEPAEHTRLARVAVDILRPIPLGVLTTRTRLLRPGKRVALLETVLAKDGRDVLVARGWRIATSASAPVVGTVDPLPEIPPEAPAPRFPGGHQEGYLSEIDWRFVSGNFTEPGPCRVWVRPRIPLLPGEELSPMCRTVLVADSGSGVSMTVDPLKYTFMNVDLTVIVHRDPVGEFVLLDAVTSMGGTGTGLAETRLADTSGVVGSCLQTLLVARR